MKEKHIFGLVVKVLGLAGVLWGCSYVVSVIYYLLGSHPEGYTLYHYVVASVVTLALGLYFLRGAPHIVRFAYPDDEKKDGGRDDAA